VCGGTVDNAAQPPPVIRLPQNLPALLSSGEKQPPRQTNHHIGLPMSGLVGGKFVRVVAKEASISVGTGTGTPACHPDQQLPG
jgi:hypothetical protein